MIQLKLGVSLSTITEDLNDELFQAVRESQIATLEIHPRLFDGHDGDIKSSKLKETLVHSNIRVIRKFWRPDRSPYLPLGPKGSDDGGMMFMGAGALEMGDEIYQYYSARGVTHSEERYHPELFPMVDGKPVMEGLGVVKQAVQEKDRFIGLAAGRGRGELITAPFTFEGKELKLDVNCGGKGWAKVELLDEHGFHVWEYDLGSAERIYLNRPRAQVGWKKGRNLSQFEGKPIRLRIVLVDARLYGMRFMA